MSNSPTNPSSRRDDADESLRQANELQCESKGIPLKQVPQFGHLSKSDVTLRLTVASQGAPGETGLLPLVNAPPIQEGPDFVQQIRLKRLAVCPVQGNVDTYPDRRAIA